MATIVWLNIYLTAAQEKMYITLSRLPFFFGYITEVTFHMGKSLEKIADLIKRHNIFLDSFAGSRIHYCKTIV
jgi:hypothetical protein